MRFYFQDSGQKVATKCIRVASDATVEDVIGTLVEKFRPDMRMLSVPSYALYELHEHCPERKMEPDEKPLLVQLNWHVDDREGRFLLKNVDDKTVRQFRLAFFLLFCNHVFVSVEFSWTHRFERQFSKKTIETRKEAIKETREIIANEKRKWRRQTRWRCREIIHRYVAVFNPKYLFLFQARFHSALYSNLI